MTAAVDRKIIEDALQGSAYALGRLISYLDHPEKRVQIMKEIEPLTGKAYTLGITGPPGAGKSTLLSRLVSHIRSIGLTVGLLCVDPTSPFSGGSLLGDRLRMEEHTLDPGVFIRSLASRDRLGGTSPTTREAVKILDASGRDLVIVESAGAGQSQVDLKKITDTIAVVTVPGLGDSIQMLKAGIMEIADIFVLNMSDRAGAENTVDELKTASSRYAGPWKPPVVSTVAIRNEGIGDLYQAIADHRTYLEQSGILIEKRRERSFDHTMELVAERLQEVTDRKLASEVELQQLIEMVKSGKSDPYSAAARIVTFVLRT